MCSIESVLGNKYVLEAGEEINRKWKQCVQRCFAFPFFSFALRVLVFRTPPF